MTSLNRPNYQPPSLAHSLKRHLDTRSNESLIGDFVCMHSAGGLTPGHLYCRKNSLAFYASAMRGENKILLSFDGVIRIKKPNHLGYMDNAIEIICKDDRTYTFVQFPNRDAAYTLLTRLFRSYVKTKKELHDSKSNSISPQNNESRASITQELSREEKENDVEKDVEKKEEQAESKSETSEDKSLQSSNSEKSNAENDDDAVSVNYLDNYSETIKAVLPVSAEQAYELYFDEGCVFPYGEHLAHTGGYNVKVGKWKVNEQSHRPERRMHFNKVLQGIFYDTEMGTKSIQSCRKGNDGTITIAMKDKLINVPYAESYYIKEKFVLSPTEESEDKCLITGSVKTVFTGDCCMKEMLHDRVCEDKKKEHEMWLKYIEEHKLFQKPVTESNQQIVLPENEDSKPNTTEDEKIAAINPKEIAHGKDDIAEGLRLPLTPRPSIDKEFTSNEDADKMEGKTCSDMLKEMSEKATIQPKKLAKTLKAVNKTLPEAEEPEKEKQSSLSALEEEKPATNQQTNSLASVDSSSKAFTGIFDSPVQSKTSGLKDIYGKIRDSAVSKKLGHEMEKVKDFIVKQEVKTEKNLSHNEQKLSLALAKANKMGRILVIAFVVLFFLFVTTTVHLSSKIGRLQENCNLSSI